MSYNNDKERMNREAEAHQRLVWKVIKVTFMAFAVALLLFCAMWCVCSIFGIGQTKDTEPPIISGRDGNRYIGYVGDTPMYKQMVKVVDDTDSMPTLEINNSNVNINKEGEYKVYYRATDASGNVSEIYVLTYVIKSKEFSEETLMAQIAELADELNITKDMTKEQQVRAIYKYVNSKNAIEFTDESNIPDIDRNDWQIDWVEEAILTIDSGEGDCYSYYSLSKAFFEYFDIENVGIKRSPASEEPGTHFWCAVKVEGGWYYYDATSLAGQFEDGTRNACLITQKKLNSYVTSKGGEEFYKMDKLPGVAIATKALD